MPKLWLDDERDPKSKQIQMQFGAEGDEIWAKSANVAINHLKKGNITSISLDHDLGPNAGTGLDVAVWIEEQAYLGKLPKLTWFVHSMNPVGSKNITVAMNNAEKYWNEPL